MFRRIFVASTLVFLSFCVHAQEVFDLRVNTFESFLKKFSDEKYLPENKCEEFIERRGKLNSLSLYVGAAHCFRQSSWWDAATLLAMADVKFEFDQIRYPVTSQDKDALFKIAYIRTQAFSLYGNEYIFEGESDTVQKIAASMSEWDVDFLTEKSPGWLYKKNNLSNQELRNFWNKIKYAKISAIESVGFFLKKSEMLRARQAWMAATKNLENAKVQLRNSVTDAGSTATVLMQVLKEHEKTTAQVYFRMIDEMDDVRRPYIKNFDQPLNIRDLVKIDPRTLNPIDEVRGNVDLYFLSPSIVEFKFNLDSIQSIAFSFDILSFMSLCVADLTARLVPGHRGWQIGTNQQDFESLKFRVKLLKSSDEVLHDGDYKFSGPTWFSNEIFKQSCPFMRRGYFEK